MAAIYMRFKLIHNRGFSFAIATLADCGVNTTGLKVSAGVRHQHTKAQLHHRSNDHMTLSAVLYMLTVP